MDPRYESLLAELERLRSTARSAGDANSGMVKSMERLKLEEELRIKQLSKATGVSEKELAAREKVAKAADDAAISETKRTQAAEKAAKDAEARQAERDKKQTEAILKAVGSIKGLGSQALNVTAGMYGTTQVFEGAIPTLKLLGDTTKAVVGAITSLGSAIPFIGGAFKAADNALGAITSMVVAVASLELQMAQKYYDTYQQVNKAGVGFSGSIGGLKAFLDESQVSLGTFSRFLTASRDDLLGFGGGLEIASKNVLNLGKGLAAANPKLLILMGGLDGLYGGIADYGSSLARLGIDLAKQPELMKKGLTEYLYTLKEVETITGMSVEQQRKANEARSTEILYQKRVQEIMAEQPGEKGAAAVSKVNAVLTVLESQFGKDSPMFAKLAKEVFGNRGQLVNASTIGFSAMVPGLADALKETFAVAESGGDTGAALAKFVDFIKSKQGVLAGGSIGGLASIYGANPDMQDSVRDMLQFFAVAGAKNLTVQKLLEGIEAAKQGRGASPGDLTTKTAQALIALEKNQITMDNHVATNLGKMADLAKVLTDLNTKLIKEFGPLITTSIEFMNKMIEKLFEIADQPAVAERNRRAEQARARGEDEARRVRYQPGQETPEARRQRVKEAGIAAEQQYRRSTPVSAVSAEMAAARAGLPPTPPGAPPGSTPLAPPNATMTDIGSLGLRLGSGVSGPLDPKFAEKLAAIAGVSGLPMVSSLYRTDDEKSKHYQGKAADFGLGSLVNGSQSEDEKAQVIASILTGIRTKASGINVFHEGRTHTSLMDKVNALLPNMRRPTLANSDARGPGNADHIHMEMMAKGGITSGPSIAGEAGPEAVIPLPDGRSIPVKIDMGDLVDAINELIAINRDQLDMQNRIVQVSA